MNRQKRRVFEEFEAKRRLFFLPDIPHDKPDPALLASGAPTPNFESASKRAEGSQRTQVLKEKGRCNQRSCGLILATNKKHRSLLKKAT